MVIWQADGSYDGVHGYGFPLAERLAAAGVAFTMVPLPERAPDAAELSAPVHLLSGGDTSADADVAWVIEARRSLSTVLERARDGEATVTGVCFGAQLIARVLAGSGTVGPHRHGMQAGLYEVSGTGRQSRSVVSSFHYHHIDPDRVAQAGGTVTLTSDRTPVQGFRFGSTVRGVQFHPELGPDHLRATVAHHAGLITRRGGSVRRAAASIRLHGARWADTLADHLALGSAPMPDRAPVPVAGAAVVAA